MRRKRTVKRHDVIQPLDQNIRIIPLTRGYNTEIDAVEFERVSKLSWFALPSKKTSNVYAARMEHLPDGKKRLVLLHRFIMQCDGDVDHEDGNTLNNKKSNLRPCTDTQNGGNQKLAKNNTSGYKGVHWHNQALKWQAGVFKKEILKRKYHSCGLFDDKIDAARAYDRKAIELFGDFARTNFSRADYE